MKPLLKTVVAICLILAAQAHPENIEEVKELSQSKEPVVEAEESEPQTRTERCSTSCSSGSLKLNLKSPNDVLAAIQALPPGEVHTQQSFEGCSSEKGCAGIKLKDGKVVERFGNVDAFRAAAASNTGNEFTFHAADAFNNILAGGIPKGGPFWWMNQNSPFKNTGSSSSFEKFSKSSSFTSGGAGAGATGVGATGSGASFGGSIDLSANPFLNGDFSKLASGFTSAGGVQAGGVKPSSFQSSSFESSSFSSSNKGGIDLSQNPFLNGGLNKFAQSGFQAQGAFGATGQGASQGAFGSGVSSKGTFGSGTTSQSAFDSGSSTQGAFGSSAGSQNAFGTTQSGFASGSQGAFASGAGVSGSKFSTPTYTGSSPSPFTGSTVGSGVNLIQNTQKTSEFNFDQQQQTQQNIDDLFQGTGNVAASESSGGELQQTCAGQGYVCVYKAQCNNGVVNYNDASLLQARTKKQYCNTRTETCCRIETSTLAGSGPQGSLGVGSATYSGSSQGSGLFAGQAGQGTFGTGQSSTGNFGSSKGTFGQGSTISAGFGSTVSSFGTANRGVSASGSFGSNVGSTVAPSGGTTGRFGSTTSNFNNDVYKTTGKTNFIERDSFSAGSETAGVYRPGASGSGLKPGIPYLPPVDSSHSGTNVVSSTVFPTTPRPFTTPKPTYLPPVSSTSAPGYLPPVQGEPSINTETRLPPNPVYNEGQLILDENRPPRPKPTPIPAPNEIPAGCAAALKCTPIEFCTAEGVISNTTVILTRDQESYRVPLTDCKDLETGRIGKCCRDPTYTDPWPTNQLGKWVPGVFGGNDGKYTPDSRGSPNILRPQVTARPPGTGSVLLNNFRTPKPTVPTFGPNQVTPGFPSRGTPSFPSAPVSPNFPPSRVTPSFPSAPVSPSFPPSRGTPSFPSVPVSPSFPPSRVTPSFPSGPVSPGVSPGFPSPVSPGLPSVPVSPAFPPSQVTPSFPVSPGFPSSVTPSFPSATVTPVPFGQKGQFEVRGQGQFGQGGQGQIGIGGQGQFGTGGQGQIDQGSQYSQNTQTYVQGQFGQRGQGSQGQGTLVTQGQGAFGTQGQGSLVSRGQGTLISQTQGAFGSQGKGFVSQGQGVVGTHGQGQLVTQGQGQFVTQDQGQYTQGGRGQFGVGGQGQFEVQGQGVTGQFGQVSGQKIFGQALTQTPDTKGQGQTVIQGQGQTVTQGFGTGVRQGQGFTVSQGAGIGVENEYSESVQRVFLSQYNAGGQCGLLNGQKPYGNRNELEVDFAEIPWQAMVLLQTNRSLLCGGVITRPDVVITSAACVDGLQAKNVLIKGGEWKLGIDDEPLPFQIVQVKHILRHPFYKRGSLINDVAILVLTENLRLAKNIYPICLPGLQETLDAFYNGAGECIVTGWGKQVLQAHLAGSIMHSVNVSLINPGECQAKLSQDYPHLLEQYDQDSCVCGQPTNPVSNICRVDIGSALACTTGDGHFVMRGIYSWDSGCQPGNQLAAFYKFDMEWYQWAIGLSESVRFSQFSSSTSVSQGRFSGQTNSGLKSEFSSGVKGGSSGAVKGSFLGGKGQFGQISSGQGQFTSGQGQFSQFSSGKFSESSGSSGLNFASQIKAPISNTFSATYTEKKVFQSEPKIVTFTTKPEIVTFTTKPEIFTYTTKPKIVTYTTKPQIVTYETSGSGNNPQYVAPGVTFNPSFSEVVGKHTHNGQCKCLENGKK